MNTWSPSSLKIFLPVTIFTKEIYIKNPSKRNLSLFCSFFFFFGIECNAASHVHDFFSYTGIITYFYLPNSC